MKDKLGHGSDPRGSHAEGVQKVGQQIKRPEIAKMLESHNLLSLGKGSGALQGAVRYQSGPETNLDALHSALAGAGWQNREYKHGGNIPDVREYGHPNSKQGVWVYHKAGRVSGALIDTVDKPR